ncbi:MAG TPA: hypothetical protein VF486_18455 [Actinomycetes bacterium]
MRVGASRHLSRTTVLACALLFAAGVVAGVFAYLQRSAVVEALLLNLVLIPAEHRSDLD